jgi:hypothetical protein
MFRDSRSGFFRTDQPAGSLCFDAPGNFGDKVIDEEVSRVHLVDQKISTVTVIVIAVILTQFYLLMIA